MKLIITAAAITGAIYFGLDYFDSCRSYSDYTCAQIDVASTS